MILGNRNIQGVLLDITGVLYESGEGYGSIINGSVEAIKRLGQNGIPFRLLTNESTTDTNELLDKLAHHGYFIDSSQLFSPIPAVKKFMNKNNLRPYLLVHQNIIKEFKEFDQINPTCVVIGDAEDNFTFKNMNTAFNVLISSDNPMILSLGKGKYYRHNNQLQLDAGTYAAALEYACDTKATIVGKPSSDYFKMALDDMGICPSNAVMVGDDIVSDIGGAQAAGIAGVLVKTGKFTHSNMNHPVVRPDFIADNLLHAINHMIT